MSTLEEELARFWRKRMKLTESDFDGLASLITDDTKIRTVKGRLAVRIFHGLPLAEQDYYLARAFHMLLSDLPYKDFFTKCWHESGKHRAYGALEECTECRKMRRKRDG